MRLDRHRHELFVAVAYLALLAVVGTFAKGFFAAGNLRDIALGIAPVLVAAIGMTLVVIGRQIDISIGSQLAIAGVVMGTLAKAGVPLALLAPLVLLAGAAMGAVNGVLVAVFELPSIVVTLATMVAWREALRWITEGADIYGLPDDFQWLGLSLAGGRTLIIGVALLLLVAFAWGMRNLAVGRTVYAVGSDAEMSRLLGIRPRRVTFFLFVMMGVLTAAAAFLASIRFPQIQTNAGVGFELQVVAATVVGGTAVSGGRGTLVGTLLGVLLLGTVGTALTFLHVSAHWERALQGAIILVAVGADALHARKAAARAT